MARRPAYRAGRRRGAGAGRGAATSERWRGRCAGQGGGRHRGAAVARIANFDDFDPFIDEPGCGCATSRVSKTSAIRSSSSCRARKRRWRTSRRCAERDSRTRCWSCTAAARPSPASAAVSRCSASGSATRRAWRRPPAPRSPAGPVADHDDVHDREIDAPRQRSRRRRGGYLVGGSGRRCRGLRDPYGPERGAGRAVPHPRRAR